VAVRVAGEEGMVGPIIDGVSLGQQVGLPGGEVVHLKRQDVGRAEVGSLSTQAALEHQDDLTGIEPHRLDPAISLLAPQLSQPNEIAVEAQGSTAVRHANGDVVQAAWGH
jgi:hypothetical protein